MKTALNMITVRDVKETFHAVGEICWIS